MILDICYCHLDYVHRRGAEHIRYEVTPRVCHSERRSDGREDRSERVPSGHASSKTTTLVLANEPS